ncbi:hypothetical protein AgCh_031712 [Apium graveolens]
MKKPAVVFLMETMIDNNRVEAVRAKLKYGGLFTVADLDMKGHPFTWEKSRGTERWVEERVDRVCVNDSWRSLFPLNKVVNLIAPTSDHSAIYQHVHVWRPVQRGCRFRFENAWLREEGCGKVVEDCWKNNGHFDIFQKLEVCANELTSWGKKMVSQFEERIKQCRQRMDRFKGHSDAFSVQCYREAMENYEKILAQQDDFWKQRAKQHWLQVEDSNSKFFHAYASARKKKNSIKQLKDEEGVWRDWANGLKDIVGGYYEKLFQSQGSNGHEVLACIQPSITNYQNSLLLQDFTCEEVKEALFYMHPDKSPGPDGIISKNQSVFIPGRLITGNVMAAFEINHWMKRKTQGKKGFAALKMDMSKAYDRATAEEAQCINSCLNQYEKATGQQVNFQKSSLHFSSNTSDIMVQERGGKEILIKAVVQAIPSYVMSVFLLPKILCEELERLMNKFWWLSNMENNTGIRWMCWDKFCQSKKLGGMGFRKIREFNVAMLGKQAWRWQTENQSLTAKLMQARYYPSGSFRDANIGGNPCFIWRSIFEAKQLIEAASRVKVGNGESIKYMA